uniref:PPPDE domain-containing protein n=1 Tax=Globisporangium ultimum (strain ATCC 200006 / CBS 805.95 / DAOM BR144) TaxID=431595 RepID=K3WZI6_GLOUD
MASSSFSSSASSSAVSLRVYDLSRGMARQLSPALLGKQIDGIWHTGVLVYGKEYFFGGGIQVMAPELVVARYGMQPVQVVPLGTTSVPMERFEDFLQQISPRFTTMTYDLLRNNCNNFSNELSMFLVGTGIPQHILDLPNEALSTPLGAMLRPMIENMQREMNATGAQPFAIPFNDPSLANAPVAASASASTSSVALSSRRFKISGKPTLHLARIVARVDELNEKSSVGILTDEEIAALRKLPTQVTDNVDLRVLEGATTQEESVQLWKILVKLLSEEHGSLFFFPALGIFRVLLLLPVKSTEILEMKNKCFDQLLLVTENSSVDLPDAHVILLLSVLVNGFVNPVASELVLSRSVRFLPFAFSAITDSSNHEVRVLGANLISNCCLALKIEEEVVITAVICGAVETLDRLSRDQYQSPTQQQAIEGVIVGIGSLLYNFEAARSLSVELGLPEVLRRLHTTSSLVRIQPLLSEIVAMI